MNMISRHAIASVNNPKKLSASLAESFGQKKYEKNLS